MLFLLEEIAAVRVGVEENILSKYSGFVETRIWLNGKSKREHNEHARVEDRPAICISLRTE